MKTKENKVIKLSISLYQNHLQVIDKMATDRGITRSQMLRLIIERYEVNHEKVQ